jgi:hypothetical protein
MDFDRVYSSDMKKMIRWFRLLKDNDVHIKLSELEDEASESEEMVETEAAVETPAEEKPKKKAANKKTEPADADTAVAAEKPKKKAAKKKAE